MKRLLKTPAANLAFKAIVLLLLAGILYFELTAKQNLPEIWQIFREKMQGANRLWLVLAFALMPLNWLAETRKWHQFVRRYEPMSRWKALRAVLAGVAVSLFTPNRVGEYGGRILFIKSKHQWKAVIANLVGNFAQILILFLTGVSGATWFMFQFTSIDQYLIIAYVVFSSVGLGLLFFTYFNIDLVAPFVRRLPYINHIKRFVKDVRVLRQFSRRELTEILGWAIVRYLIYSTQYFCLLRFFDVNPGFIGGYLSIGAIFLLQTSIPLPPVMGLLARGNVAVHVWSHFGANEVSILAATFGLWILNLILPALFGTFFIFNVNITKSLGYEDDPDR